LRERLVISGIHAGEIDVPENLCYSKEYQWLSVEVEKCRVGPADYAQKQHEIVFTDPPPVGGAVTAY